MKKLLSIALVFCFLFIVAADAQTRKRKPHRGTAATAGSMDRKLIRGPRGGCYYINRNGNKTYVDRSLCN